MIKNFAHIVRGSGPGLLLAHGGGGSVAGNFGTILDDLATTHTIIGPDYPGAGATPRSEAPLDLDDVADTLVRTAVDAGVERFTILGYSLGTGVAVRAATRHPERVTCLVLTAGFAHPDNRIRLAVDVWRGLLEHGDRTLLAKFLTYAASGERHLNALSEEDLAASVAWLADFIPAGSPEHADEWQGIGEDPREFASRAARLRELTDRKLRVGTRIEWRGGGEQLPRVLARARALAAAGAEMLGIKFGCGPEVEQHMAQLAEALL